MFIIKCKMCGGDMELSPDKTFGTCKSCGNTMALPKVDDGQQAAAFHRSNHPRQVDAADAEVSRRYQDAGTQQEQSYQSACKAQSEVNTTEEFENAAGCFRALGTCKESETRAAACQTEAVAVREKRRAESRSAYEARCAVKAARKKRMRLLGGVGCACIALAVALFLLVQNVLLPAKNYNMAVALEKDGETAKAAIAFGKAGHYRDAKARSFALWEKAAQRESVSAGYRHTVGLKSDGTVIAVGGNEEGQCDVAEWTDIVAISAGDFYTVGLRSDGTAAAVGDNFSYQCNVAGWTDIVAISAGHQHTVGLKSDGTVVIVGNYKLGQRALARWTDIVAISAGNGFTAGLKSDGTVLVVGDRDFNDFGQYDVTGWTDIVAISAGFLHTVGLKSDGTVVATGQNDYGQCDVAEWTDIVAISAGDFYTVGLKSDGTVVATGDYNQFQRNVARWADIVAVSAGGEHIIGLKSPGTVITVGNNDDGQRDVTRWADIKLPNQYLNGKD